MKRKTMSVGAVVLSAVMTLAVPVTYQLPAVRSGEQTWLVSLAIVDEKNTDWIISTFVAGQPRTVTPGNNTFTEHWDGLDENFMPVPPGTYAVKGICSLAEKWEVDGQYHAVTASWHSGVGAFLPARGTPELWKIPVGFHGDPVNSPLRDVDVTPEGIAVFYYQYLENGKNAPMFDLTQPPGPAQFLRAHNSGGAGGGPCVATDGETVWACSTDGAPWFIYRADGKPFGTDHAMYRRNVYMPKGVVNSMTAWRDPETGKSYVYVLEAEKIVEDRDRNNHVRHVPSKTDRINQITVLDGETGEVLGGIPVQGNPLSIVAKGGGLYVLYTSSGGMWGVEGFAWQFWTRDGGQGTLPDLRPLSLVPRPSSTPADLEMDTEGRLYVSFPKENKVRQYDKAGKELRTFGSLAAQPPGRYDRESMMAPGKLATWKDPQGVTRLLVVEGEGPNRVSEWNAETGAFIREYATYQTKANNGYAPDPADPSLVYLPGQGGWMVRWKVDYDKGTWAVDAVWPDVEAGQREGLDKPVAVRANGRLYLASEQSTTVYRLTDDGSRLVRSAGIIRRGEGDSRKAYFWNDANGNGAVDDDELRPCDLPKPGQVLTYHGQKWLDDLTYIAAGQHGKDVWSTSPSGFDAHGNPIFTEWKKVLTDPIFEAIERGSPGSLHGGNELDSTYSSDWAQVNRGADGSLYVQARGGKSFNANEGAQFKISRYVEVEKLKSTEVEKLKSTEVEKLKSREVEKLKSTEVEKLKSREVEKLKSTEVEKLKSIEVEKLKSIEVEKLKSIEVEKLKNTEVEKLKNGEVPTSQLLNSSTSQLLNSSTSQLFRLLWRVGRSESIGGRGPGHLAGAMRVFPAYNGIVSVIDQSRSGVVLYTDDGIYLDTLFPPGETREEIGVYRQPGEFFAGTVYPNPQNGRLYYAAGKYTPFLYEINGWTLARNPVRRLGGLPASIELHAKDIAPPPEVALTVRGGAGRARLATFSPAVGGAALDGSMDGWESASPVTYRSGKDKAVEVRCLYTPDALLLRYAVRLGGALNTRPMPPPERIFTHDQQADTLGFYFQGDPAAPPPRSPDGRGGDVRIVLGLFDKGGAPTPVAVGLYPEWGGPGASPQTYRTPVGSVSFAHVAEIKGARLGHALDADNQGFVLAAEIPRGALVGTALRAPREPLEGERPREPLTWAPTMVNFDANLGGHDRFWWANSDGFAGTETYDEPSEARLYPGSWAPARFEGLAQGAPARNWMLLGPFGGPGAEQFSWNPQGDDKKRAEDFYEKSAYPPDDGAVDLAQVFTGPLTEGWWPPPSPFKWAAATIADLDMRVTAPGSGAQVWYGATWVHAPKATEVEAEFLSHPQTFLRWTLNGEGIPLRPTDYADAPSIHALARSARRTVTLREGWNRILWRGYCVGYAPFRAGVILHADEPTLWQLKFSGKPPQ